MATVNPVDIGNLPNDGTGDPLRVAFQKINDNFDYISGLAPDGDTGALQYIDSNSYFSGSNDLIYDPDNHVLTISLDITPTVDDLYIIGTPSEKLARVYTTQLSLGDVGITQNVDQVITVVHEDGSYGDLIVNNLTVAGTLNIGGDSGLFDFETTTDASNQIVHEIPVAEFGTGIYQITSRENDGSLYQSATMKITKNNLNTGVKYTVYGTLFSDSNQPLTTYDADYSLGYVRIKLNPLLELPMTHTISFKIDI